MPCLLAKWRRSVTEIVDALGRVISTSTPEGGTVTYTYDNLPSQCQSSSQSQFGQLTSLTNPDGTTICYYHDSLGRIVNVVPTFPNTCRLFFYDNSSGAWGQGPPSGYVGNNLTGRLVEAETNNCVGWPPTDTITDEWFSYDKNGRLTDIWESTPNSGGYYHTCRLFPERGAANPKRDSGLPYDDVQH